jgi:hypothetical protein
MHILAMLDLDQELRRVRSGLTGSHLKRFDALFRR